MEAGHRLARIEADGARLLDVASTDLAAEVPACPGWDAARLVGHVGRVWRSVAAHVATRATEVIPGSEIPSPPDGEAVVAFAREGLGEVLAALRDTDPATPVWSWAGTDHSTAGFYIRRMHQETLVHRVDAEQAAGLSSVVDPDDGGDGVDELCSVLLAGRTRGELPAGSLHLHRTDGEGEWLLEVVDGAVAVRAEHAKGDAAVRGSGDDLLLAMWARRPLDGLDVFGDPAVAAAWVALQS